MAVQPITPGDVAAQKARNLPDIVIEVWNETIAKHFVDGRSKFEQEEVVKALMRRTNCRRETVFDDGWLDIEALYEAAEWTVTYDKPGFNETYAATFEFIRK